MATTIVTYQNGVKKTAYTEQHEQQQKFRPVYMCIMDGDGDGDGNVAMEKSVCFFFSVLCTRKRAHIYRILCAFSPVT